MTEPGRRAGGAVAQPAEEVRARHAPRYRVLIHNDPVTDMDFVVQVLQRIFHKPRGDAVGIMWTAHTSGLAHVTTLPLEQAEFRVDQAHSLARGQGYPLTFTYEPED